MFKEIVHTVTMKFKRGDKLIVVKRYCSHPLYDPDVNHQLDCLTINEIHTIKSIRKDKAYKSGYAVNIKEKDETYCLSFFESAEKIVHDINFKDKINRLIDEV